MDSQNIVPIGRAYRRSVPAQVSAQEYAEAITLQRQYRTMYDRNTADLSQVRGELLEANDQLRAARQQVIELERELAAHRAGEPLAILGEAMKMLTDMVTDTREDERALGAVGVRLPAASTQHTAAGEALISRAAPLLTSATVTP